MTVIAMSRTEIDRMSVLRDLAASRIKVAEAAALMSLGRRQVFRLAKAYHPDRYATAELPAEVRDYLAAMARRINAAHAALEVPLKKQAVRQEPVFTSPGR